MILFLESHTMWSPNTEHRTQFRTFCEIDVLMIWTECFRLFVRDTYIHICEACVESMLLWKIVWRSNIFIVLFSNNNNNQKPDKKWPVSFEICKSSASSAYFKTLDFYNTRTYGRTAGRTHTHILGHLWNFPRHLDLGRTIKIWFEHNTACVDVIDKKKKRLLVAFCVGYRNPILRLKL